MKQGFSLFILAVVCVAYVLVVGLGGCSSSPPQAEFSAQVASGDAPLNVQFTDASVNHPDSWNWDFGDGATGATQSPSHEYTKAGTYAVTLRVGNKAGSNEATKQSFVKVSPGPIATIELTLQKLEAPAGGTISLSAHALDSLGNEIPGLQFSWKAASGEVDGNGNFKPGTKAGTLVKALTVQAEYKGAAKEASADIMVLPGPLARAEVASAPITVKAGESTKLSARGLDEFGNAVAGTVSYSAASGGQISAEGVFTAGTRAGSFKDVIEAQVVTKDGSRKATASVNVTAGPPVKVTIEPSDAIVKAGETLAFQAKVLDTYENIVEAKELSWHSAAAEGMLSPEGKFTAGTKSAKYEGAISVSLPDAPNLVPAKATVTVLPGPVDKVEVTPAIATLEIKGTQQFQAKATDKFGNEITAAKITWTVADKGVGVVDNKALFAAGTKAGVFDKGIKVTAVVGDISKEATASVKINPGPPAKLSVSPLELAAGGTKQLAAFVADQYDNPLKETTVTWTVRDANVGSISAAGILTLGEVAGSFKDVVEAKAADGGLSAQGSVNITPGPLEQVVLAPNPAEIGIGMTQQFVAVGADRYGNRIPGLQFIWSVEAGGGAVDARGLFTAGDKPGTYNKTAKATAKQGDITRSGLATITVEPDRMVFVSDREGGKLGIYTMNADGSNAKVIAGAGTNLPRLSWSPDGRRIVYSYSGKIVVMSDDGAWLNTILSEAFNAYEPDWSPDGSKIVYQSYENGKSKKDAEIYVMDADGGNRKRLTNNSYYDDYPVWSPDGKKIAFTSDPDGDGLNDIYVMDADGSNKVRITFNGDNIKPRWSPDGTQIAFQYGVPGALWGVKVASATGGGEHIVSGNDGGLSPAWLPDGKRIVFMSYRDSKFTQSSDPLKQLKGAEIYIADLSGSNVVRLTNNEAFDDCAVWAPRKRGVAVSEDSIIIPHTSTFKPLSVKEVTDRARAAVVRIETDLGSGSGFVIDPGGLVMTNNHVVRNAKTITVFLEDGTRYTGKVLGMDLLRDLAVVKIDGSNFPVLALGDISSVSAGSDVIAIGYPLGLTGLTMTSGLATGIKYDSGSNVTMIQTDATINPGNSGGPLLNRQGQVMGLVTSRIQGEGLQGLNFAVGANSVKVYLNRLKAGEVITN